MPEVLYLEAPATQLTPPTTPILDVDFNQELPTTPSLHLDTEDQMLGEHRHMAINQNLVGDQHLEDDVEASIATHTILLSEDADDVDSISSDAAKDEVTGEAAAPNVDADVAGPSGHAPQ